MYLRGLKGVSDEVDSAAVDGYHLSRDEAGFLGGEEDGDIGDVLRLTDSTEHALLREVLYTLSLFVGASAKQ